MYKFSDLNGTISFTSNIQRWETDDVINEVFFVSSSIFPGLFFYSSVPLYNITIKNNTDTTLYLNITQGDTYYAVNDNKRICDLLRTFGVTVSWFEYSFDFTMNASEKNMRFIYTQKDDAYELVDLQNYEILYKSGLNTLFSPYVYTLYTSGITIQGVTYWSIIDWVENFFIPWRNSSGYNFQLVINNGWDYPNVNPSPELLQIVFGPSIYLAKKYDFIVGYYTFDEPSIYAFPTSFLLIVRNFIIQQGADVFKTPIIISEVANDPSSVSLFTQDVLVFEDYWGRMGGNISSATVIPWFQTFINAGKMTSWLPILQTFAFSTDPPCGPILANNALLNYEAVIEAAESLNLYIHRRGCFWFCYNTTDPTVTVSIKNCPYYFNAFAQTCKYISNL